MSYVALYRKWRPQTFDDVIEQSHIVETLKNSVSYQRIAHAYLFYGTRGTGKTSIARIFARAINCKNNTNGNPCNQCEPCKSIMSSGTFDIIEIDAASNNGVDNIREMRDDTTYLPSYLKYKVYIIDEVHMLSQGAFNALLKILEEPPPHVVFVLATTESNKLPATILSRCQRYEFKRISLRGIVDKLYEISQTNNTNVEDNALKLIASMCDGAMRDAISMLDQCICLNKKQITYNDVINILGIPSNQNISNLVDAIHERNDGKALKLIEDFISDGKEVFQLISGMISYYRSILLYSLNKDLDSLMGFSEEIIKKMQSQANELDIAELTDTISELCSIEQSLKWSSYQRILIEIGIVKLCEREKNTVDKTHLSIRISELEKQIEEIKNNGIVKDTVTESSSRVNKKNGTSMANVHDDVGSTPTQQGKNAKNVVGLKNANCTNNELQIKECIKEWKEILEIIKKTGKMTIYINLMNTKLVYINENVLGLLFSSEHRFNYSFISKSENLSVVHAAVCSKIGKDVTVKCILLDEHKTEEVNNNFIEKTKDIANKHGISLNIVE